jgi:maltooligosyltrehalose trehalohydrolase
MPSHGASSPFGPRHLPVGAEVVPGGVHFRVWAPQRKKVEIVVGDSRSLELTREPEGYFSGFLQGCSPGEFYRYRLDEGDAFPDPASRFQPQGVHGPSEVSDPSAFRWTDHTWSGVPIEGQVLYEMHIGTFTREGTYESALRELPELAATGITVLELMPVAEFPGRFGWGYDGVNLYAPTRNYGRPDDLRRFVDKAHSLGLGVILDVVYNHVGPDGNYFKQFAEDYFTDRYKNEWGEALNYDGENSGPVREFFIANAGYWIEEFHLDGLRLDATQAVHDESADHILAAVTRRVREAARGRSTIVVAENEPQHVKLVKPPDQGGYGMDALWNDDFHHSAMAAMTGHNQAYYSDHLGKPQEFISAVKYGFLFQGQIYTWQGKRRGTPALGIKPSSFVTFLQNHDQIANSGRGQRCHVLTSPGRYRAMTALMLLAPGTPMLFQGQEFAASSPFYYFAGHQQPLAGMVHHGRIDFLSQFPSLRTPEMQACFRNPADESTFQSCKLDFGDRKRNAHYYALTRDLLRLRREQAAFRAQRPGGVDGAVLGPEVFVLRFFGAEERDHRLLLINTGLDLSLDPAPEPLLAPLEGQRWHTLWSSEHPTYGGCGTPALDAPPGWRIPGHAAVVLAPAPATEDEFEHERRFSHHVTQLRKREKAGDV